MELNKSIILYSADLHGNKTQYSKLFQKAQSEKVGAIILGGDLAPKDKKNRTPQMQRKFFTEFLFKTISKFRLQNPQIEIFIMLGNDDFKSNLDLLLESAQDIGFKVIQDTIVSYGDDFFIIGYSYVPITPFGFKDWEKVDCEDVLEEAYRSGFRTDGFISVKNELIPTKLDLSKRSDTIENDLLRLFHQASEKKCILVTHAPPYNTDLDLTKDMEHVGSIAVKRIIERKKPVISIHGHIHETVEKSGKFSQEINNTICFSPGNNNLSENLTALLVDINNPNNTQRIIF